MTRKALGRGLGALIPGAPAPHDAADAMAARDGSRHRRAPPPAATPRSPSARDGFGADRGDLPGSRGGG